MISANQYQDIELQQNADFTNVITCYCKRL